MAWLQKLQSLPQNKKIKIMWLVAIAVVILLIFAWVISYKFRRNGPADTTLFKTIGQGIHDVKTNYGK